MTQTEQYAFERCCRLCAEEQDVTIMIFSEEAEAMLLQKKLDKYLLVKVAEGDALPKNICISCCSKLQSVCDFIDKIHEAQEMLMQRTLISDIVESNINDEPLNFNNVNFESDVNTTKIEINVDPMMVLQNSEGALSPQIFDNNLSVHDVTHLHDVDGENVTIKLIRNGELKSHESSPNLKKYKPFQCKVCKKSYYTEFALKNHSWVHPTFVGQAPDKTNLETDNNKLEGLSCSEQHKITKGLCQLCGRSFRSERTFRAHMAVHASTKNSFTCKICGQSYKTWGSLRSHSVTHSSERPYICHFCKKSFKRKQDLKFHINQHTGAKPYKCPFCDKSFASSGNCYSHRNRMHPGKLVEAKVIRRTGPPKENQIMQSRAIPKPHITKVKGIYKYQCQICEHSFLRRDNYTYHMYQHTGEKPYKCSLCPEKFVTRKGLLIHHDKQHSSEDRPLALLSKNLLLK